MDWYSVFTFTGIICFDFLLNSLADITLMLILPSICYIWTPEFLPSFHFLFFLPLVINTFPCLKMLCQYWICTYLHMDILQPSHIWHSQTQLLIQPPNWSCLGLQKLDLIPSVRESNIIFTCRLDFAPGALISIFHMKFTDILKIC